MKLVDTHAHLDLPAGRQALQDWLEGAKTVGVNKIISIGTSVEASRKCVEIAEKYSMIRHSRVYPVEGRASGNPENGSSIKLRMTEKEDLQIYATVGIHAEDGKGDIEKYGSLDKCINELRMIARDSKASSASKNRRVYEVDSIASLQNDKVGRENDKVIVGVGECGYDLRENTTAEEKKFQKELFEAQIELAMELGLPLVVHCRNAWEETFEVLDSIALRYNSGSTTSLQNDKDKGQNDKNGLRGVFHSWTGDWEAAQKALDMGFYISFSGIVTFKNAPKVQEVASKMPIDRMLLETDSPFLTPEPLRNEYYRKKGSNPPTLSSRRAHMRNEPKNVRIVGKFIADLRHQPFELISDTTSANATKLFGL